jgi:hypothetical protein
MLTVITLDSCRGDSVHIKLQRSPAQPCIQLRHRPACMPLAFLSMLYTCLQV